MKLHRRAWALALLAAGGAARSASMPTARDASAVTMPRAAPQSDPVRRGRPITFPQDHGAHPAATIEWWYLTGWLGAWQAPRWGLQITFFRRRTGLAEGNPSRFAARQLLFAHAALTDLQARQHHHAQRLVRWSGHGASVLARCELGNTDMRIQQWWLRRDGVGLRAGIDGSFNLSLAISNPPPPLLQGDAGFSRKGPGELHASHYYSQPQMALQAELRVNGQPHRGEGLAWLDHEWSDALMPPDAVGWDWIGMQLADGSALTAYQLRRADGSALWAGGSWRASDGTTRVFDAHELRWSSERLWASATSGARYPVRWRVTTPAGAFTINALLDSQELDHRASTGVLYWEGLAEALDARGQRVGLGYLEMTGYGQPLRLT